MAQVTIEQLGQTTKAKYPQYANLPDAEVGQKILEKYPEYQKSVIPSAQPSGQVLGTTENQEPKKKSIFGKIGDFFTGSTQKLANTLGSAASAGYANKLQEQSTSQQMGIDDAVRRKMSDPNVSPEQKQKLLKTSQQNTPDQIIDSNPDFQKTGKQIAGEAFGTIGEIASFGALGKGAKAVKGAVVAKQTVKELAKEGAKQGAKYGTVFGAQKGASDSLQRNEGFGDIAKNTIKGGIFGGVTGAALGAGTSAVIGAVSNKIASNATRRAEEINLLKNNVPDATVATKKLEVTRPSPDLPNAKPEVKVVTDKTAKEVVRQGIEEPDVALMKTFTNSEREAANKMLDIRKTQMTQRTKERAYDVAGDAFDRQAQKFETVFKKKGEAVNQAAKSLKGQKVDATPVAQEWGNILDSNGIEIGPKGKLKFKGTIFEGTKQKDLQDAHDILMRIMKTRDASALHTLKGFIDQRVKFVGGEGAGLKGKAATILKQMRHFADETLDKKFPTYNKANAQFKDMVGVVERIKAQLGKNFNIGDDFIDADLSPKMRGLLSNNRGRAEVLSLLSQMEKVGKKYGIKSDEDVFKLANFADVLEKEFGSEAPTSFQGGIERGIQHAQDLASAGSDVARGTPGGLVSGAMKAGKFIYNATRGVNQENRIKALRELIKLQKKSVFGKKS
jgi:hypothetical protein